MKKRWSLLCLPITFSCTCSLKGEWLLEKKNLHNLFCTIYSPAQSIFLYVLFIVFTEHQYRNWIHKQQHCWSWCLHCGWLHWCNGWGWTKLVFKCGSRCARKCTGLSALGNCLQQSLDGSLAVLLLLLQYWYCSHVYKIVPFISWYSFLLTTQFICDYLLVFVFMFGISDLIHCNAECNRMYRGTEKRC